MHCWLQILARASEESAWQPKWWGSLSEWIMDNLWMPLGGHSHMTMIILSYKPLVPNRLWLRKLPHLTSPVKTPLFVFQTRILRHLEWEQVTEGKINYVFLSYFTRRLHLKWFWSKQMTHFALTSILFLACLIDLQILRAPPKSILHVYKQTWKLKIQWSSYVTLKRFLGFYALNVPFQKLQLVKQAHPIIPVAAKQLVQETNDYT